MLEASENIFSVDDFEEIVLTVILGFFNEGTEMLHYKISQSFPKGWGWEPAINKSFINKWHNHNHSSHCSDCNSHS